MMIQVALVAVLVACAQYYAWTVGRSGRPAQARGRSLQESDDRGIRRPF